MKTKITGWGVFVLALIAYTITLEPSTSFWDCSEFILSAAKLEVNHPAGAPLFMMFGRLFSFLSFGNAENIARSINFMSAFFSALCIYFLYHSLLMVVEKVTANKLIISGSALLGATSFCFTDSFWFSAVEAEVYGMSMFFLTLTFWAILKWENNYQKQGNEKWLLFIAFVSGLGIGVHLLNLLILPSVVLIVGFKKYGFSWGKLIGFFGAGVLLLMLVLYVITPLPLQFLAYLDFIFVNRFKLPLHSGVLFGIVLIVSLFAAIIFYSKSKGNKIAEFSSLAIFMVLVGFSVYSVNLIRSSSNPPVNFGRPDNIFSLMNYLNREQYPKRPLVFGQNYNSPIVDVKQRYSKDLLGGKYQEVELSSTYVFDEKTTTFFPRMYSLEERHKQAYTKWIDMKGKKVNTTNQARQNEMIVLPTFSDHLRFFIKYQFAYMFGRYFMWNFVGRQNDVQGRGEILNGNWISGVKFVDNVRIGPQQNLPDWMKANRARNTYFFIPLILGCVGMFFHYNKHRESFFVVLALFVMGGLGLTIYINEVPITPRERDYVFVAAFLAFSMWIGLSFAAIVKALGKIEKKKSFQMLILAILILVSPGLLAYQNFDDHNRANRYAARDFAKNILLSCPNNAILFTSGDNDTYPLLYCQEVEGIRKDVRIVIMPFLSANWFINGLRNPKYNEKGLQLIIPQEKYDFGKLDYIPVQNKVNRDTSWEEGLKFVKSDHQKSKVRFGNGEIVDFIPTQNFSLEIKSESGTGKIPISLKGKRAIYKNELVFWDIISSNGMERPICFVSKNEAQKYGLGNYLQCEGFVYRLQPEKFVADNVLSIGKCDYNKIYRKLTSEFAWGNLADEAVYVDWNTITNLYVFQIRNLFNEVAAAFLEKGDVNKAVELLSICVNQIPNSKIPHDIFTLRQNELLYRANLSNKAENLFSHLETNIIQTLDFYKTMPEGRRKLLHNDIQKELFLLNRLTGIAANYKGKEEAERLTKTLNEYMYLIS